MKKVYVNPSIEVEKITLQQTLLLSGSDENVPLGGEGGTNYDLGAPARLYK